MPLQVRHLLRETVRDSPSHSISSSSTSYRDSVSGSLRSSMRDSLAHAYFRQPSNPTQPNVPSTSTRRRGSRSPTEPVRHAALSTRGQFSLTHQAP